MDLNPQLLVIVAVVLAGILGMVFVAGLAAVALFLLRRRSAPAGPDREEMLRELNYMPVGKGSWSRKFQGTAIAFAEGKGWKWTIRLPRYNTLTLGIEEQSGGTVPDGRVFATEDADIDARFVVASELAAQAVALVTNAAVRKALLAMPHLSLRLRGDELVLDDPQQRSLGGARPGTAEAVHAEERAHKAVAGLVNAVFDSLYSRATGTIMPEHR